jgi:thioredoxin reductase (NADPH)
MVETDIAIVGAGAAGLSAAAEAARAGLQVLVIERMGAGGQVMNVERITNFPGHAEISGFELGPLLQEAAEDAGAQFLLDTVESLQPEGGALVLRCEGETVRARAVIVAAGSARRRLHVPGEEELEGRGVSHCASCDGPLFRGEAVCVVGGGDSAFGEAIVLAGHAASVTLVLRDAQPHAQPALVAEATAQPNMHIVAGAEVQAITGDQAVTGLRVRTAVGVRDIAAQGVFVYAGLQADGGFLAGLVQRDAEGRIRTDAACRSSLAGVFAAGDIRSGVPYLLAACAEDGVAAARSALAYLREPVPAGA